jgi:spore germination cell wall hydrolase CwlJ-like protein
MVFSALIISLAMVNIDLHGLIPFRTSFNQLSKDVQKQVTCLAENMYFEAANEPMEGKKAVAFVTINRLQSGNYAHTICDVVFQKTGGTCQFSWYCDPAVLRKRLTVHNTLLYNDIRELATHIVVNYERMKDVTKGATYYHADYVNPGWKLMKIDQIGRHIFYKSNKDIIDRNKEII